MIEIPDILLHSRSVEDLEHWCSDNGIIVYREYELGELQGTYSELLRTIYINRTLPITWEYPVLAHEIVHAHNRHNGHQSQKIEDKINRELARLLINPAEYAFWENQYGWSTGGIAHALDMPRWLVKAYRQDLQSTSS